MGRSREMRNSDNDNGSSAPQDVEARPAESRSKSTKFASKTSSNGSTAGGGMKIRRFRSNNSSRTNSKASAMGGTGGMHLRNFMRQSLASQDTGE